MADRTFFAVVEIVLAGNGEGVGEYEVGAGNTFTIKRIQQKSTGAFDIIDGRSVYGSKRHSSHYRIDEKELDCRV